MARDIYEEILNPDRVLTLVRDFIETNRIRSVDDIENDNVIVNLPDLLEQLCIAAGYAEPDEEEQDDVDYPEEQED